MFAAGKTSGASAAAPTIDAQFNYVTMLLHGDGTNGAQNNTFIDSSSTGATVTRTGNTTQGSFTPFGPVGNWSTFFDGSQDNLYTPSTSALNVGSGNFTFECFFNVSVFNGANILRGANQYSACALLLSGTGIVYYLSSNGASWDIASAQTAISSGLSAGVWYHLALVRNGNVVTPYVNGVAGTSTTTSATFAANNGFNIGAEQNGAASGSFNGYISNVRVVVGTAVYTSNFTPPTVPLTAISGTQLLACQNSQFKDNSSNNFSFTTAGTPSVQRFNPFGASTAYSTTTIGGSGYFDGSSQLSFSTNAGYAFGTGDFTAECWYYATSNPGYRSLIETRASNGTNNGWALAADSGGTMYVYANGFILTGISVVLNTWNHVAFTRSGSTQYLFLNGVLVSSTTTARTYSDTNLGVGGVSYSTGEYWTGYLSNVRLIKGTCLYTTTFTPPTAPLTAVTNTTLLLLTTNAGIFDNAMMNDLETVGNAQISTSVVKYGTGSIAFDGTGDVLTSKETGGIFTFGTGDYTYECWIYTTTGATTQKTIFGRSNTGNINVPYIYLINSTGVLSLYYNTTIVSSTAAISQNTWTHIAVCRSSGTSRLFINGTLDGSASDTTNLISPDVLTIGGSGVAASNPFVGYIDDVRITKGFARYTANFTPPTAAFPNTGPN